MKTQSFQKLNAKQWGWIWVAYWRLWPVLLRIKFRQGDWLRAKITLATNKDNEVFTQNDSNIVLMHESVRLAARLHFLSATCLPRSIVLAEMLQSRGYDAHVRLGVGKTGNKLAGHAWVEVAGIMVAEPESVGNEFSRF